MKVLVTGATGFVGACLTRRLVEIGYDVHVFTRKESNKWRIADLSRRVTNHEVDLRDASSVEKIVGLIGPQIIYHLASYGGFTFQQDRSTIIESNLMGTVNLLCACEMVGFDYFVSTGSSSEYGIKSRPMKEDDNLEPVGDYGVSKAAAALFCQSEAIAKGLPVATLRLFSPYGRWDDPNRLISYVIKSLLRGERPRLASPRSVRDYVYIDDVLELYLNVIKKRSSVRGIYNVGSGEQHSIGEVVSIITEIIGNGLAPVWGAIENRRLESEDWVADINKVKTQLDWKPSISLRDGLERTVLWFKENLDFYL